MESSALVERRVARPLWPSLAGLLAFFAIAAVGLWWAKWTPYADKVIHLMAAPHWSGADVLNQAGAAGSAPSVGRAWAFVRAYGADIWPGFLAALLIASAVDALVPRSWLLRTLRRRGDGRSALAGGLCALPSLMCTCCTAPIAATLRRDGAPASAALAYWIGNPVLNPAVLVFLAIVAPWQWVVTRIVVGAALVFGATALVARRAPRRPAPPAVAPAPAPAPFALAVAPRRFLRTFARLCLTLLPLYFIVVFALGLFRGWLFPLDAATAHWAIPSIFAAAALGTLVVIPTAGEIPILQALAAAGVGGGTIGALLITLPAISLASMMMVARAFSVRVTVAMAGAVAASGLLAGGMLVLLGG